MSDLQEKTFDDKLLPPVKGSITKYKVPGSSKTRWRYRIYIGEDASGRKIYEGRAGFHLQREAATAMRAHITSFEVGASAKTSHTLSSWLLEWIDTYAPLRCKSLVTVERYRRLAQYLITGPSEKLRRLAERPLAAVTHIDLEPAIAALVGARGVRKKLSAKTVRHFGNLLNVALNKAVGLDYIPVNPMIRVDLPTVPKKYIRSLTPEEIQALRTTSRQHWTFALLEIALATGCRRGELLALTWRDIDLSRATVVFSRTIEQTKLGFRVKNNKNEKQRTCTLPKVALEALDALRARAVQRGTYAHRGFVFCDDAGEHLRPDLISQTVIRILRRAGIHDASLHTLRHSHASNLLSIGVPLPAVSARLGHADPQVTARIYSHALPGDDERAARAWDDLVSNDVRAGGPSGQQ